MWSYALKKNRCIKLSVNHRITIIISVKQKANLGNGFTNFVPFLQFRKVLNLCSLLCDCKCRRVNLMKYEMCNVVFSTFFPLKSLTASINIYQVWSFSTKWQSLFRNIWMRKESSNHFDGLKLVWIQNRKFKMTLSLIRETSANQRQVHMRCDKLSLI